MFKMVNVCGKQTSHFSNTRVCKKKNHTYLISKINMSASKTTIGLKKLLCKKKKKKKLIKVTCITTHFFFVYAAEQGKKHHVATKSILLYYILWTNHFHRVLNAPDEV